MNGLFDCRLYLAAVRVYTLLPHPYCILLDACDSVEVPTTPVASSTSPGLAPIYVLATGSQLPGEPLTNSELIRKTHLPIEESWIENKIKINTRYVSRKFSKAEDRFVVEPKPGCKNSELSAQAIKNALKSIGMPAASVDMIIHTSCTPDYPIPPTSALVQDILGVNDVITMDIRSACCGSSQGLVTAMQYLQTHKVSFCGSDCFRFRFVLCCTYPTYPIFLFSFSTKIVGRQHWFRRNWCDRHGYSICVLWLISRVDDCYAISTNA